jgi:hypothetical protein
MGSASSIITFSNPSAANILGANMEKSADLITASIAARAKRLHPGDLKARAAYFNAEAMLVAARYWAPDSTVRRYGFRDGPAARRAP